jgi:heptosyltransferase-2
VIQLTSRDRVLIRMPSWLGDFIMAEPALRALIEQRALFDDAAPISLVAPAPFLELLDGRFDGVARIPARRDGDASDWSGHDVAIFLDGSMRSVWRAIRAGIPNRVGWARGGRGLLLTDSVRPALERGATPVGLGRPGRWPRILPRPFGSVCHELVAAMGVPVFDVRPRLEVAERARESVRERIAAAGANPDEPFVLVNAGARPGSAKGYDPSQWARALDQLEGPGSQRIFVVGGPGEEARVSATVEAARREHVHALLDPVAGLPELAAWCAAAELVMTTDGGTRHVAAAVGTRQVVLFGPTDPRHTADVWESERHQRVEVDCGPCHRERCPVVGELHHVCMTGIRPEDVASVGAGSAAPS